MPGDTLRGLTRRRALRYGAVASGALVSTSFVGTAVAGRGTGRGGCDRVVPDDHETIQAAVDAADPGDTVCVRPGTYVEDVTVDEPVTLQGRTPATSGNPATLDGQIEVESAGSGATVSQLRIAPTDTFGGGTFPDPAGVAVKAGDVTVERNLIEGFRADLSNGEGSFTMHGVQVFGAEDAAVADVTIRNNVIRDFLSEGNSGAWPKYGGVAGVKVQAGATDVSVIGNLVSELHSAGWAWGVVLTPSGSAPGVPTAVHVEGNHLEGLNDGSVFQVFAGTDDGRSSAPYPGSAFGIDGTADASEATVQHNNLLAPNGAESKDQSHSLVTECNWWGDRSGPTHDDNDDGSGSWALERGAADIDYDPWLVSPAPSRACVGNAD